MPNTDTLPCPFCGAQMQLERSFDWHFYRCPHYGCPMHINLFDSPEAAYTATNRRAPAQQPHAAEKGDQHDPAPD